MTRATILALAVALIAAAAPACAQKPDRNAPPPRDGTHYAWGPQAPMLHPAPKPLPYTRTVPWCR